VTEPLPLPDPDAWIERIRMIGDEAFSGKYRPQFYHLAATGTTSPDDLVRIKTFVDALDTAKVNRMNRMAQIVIQHTPREQDLLNTMGEDGVVQYVNRDQAAAADPDPNYWLAMRNRVASYFGQSGELVFPHENPFEPQVGKGVVNVDIGFSAGDALLWGLEQLANVGGFLYRTIDEVGAVQRGDVGAIADRAVAMQQSGYGDGIWDNIAFNWSGGESQFRDLSAVRQNFGDEATDRAVAVFRAGGINEYMQELANDVRAGRVSPEVWAETESYFTDNPDWANVYDAVDRQHISFGRDFARLVLPESFEDDAWFTAVSGSMDAALMVAVDPTLVGTKFARSAYLARYAVDSANPSKIYRLYGLDGAGKGDPKAIAAVEDFLTRAGNIRQHRAAGDEIAEAAELAAIQRMHPRLTPLLNEVNGQRLALTPDEIARATQDGTYATLYRSGGEYPVVLGDEITTVEQWADLLINKGALMRLVAGKPATSLQLIPGRGGWWAEREVFRRMRTRRAEKTKRRTAERLSEDPPLPATLRGALAAEADDAARLLDGDPDKIIAWDWSEEYKAAFIARGAGYREAAEGRLGLARELKSKWERAQARLTNLLPEEHVIPFSSVSAGRDIERFARLALPKHEAVRLRALWERGTEATRRQIGKAIVMEVAEASGLTHSTIGRQFIMRWMQEMDNVNRLRYGLANSDVIPTAAGGAKRVALAMSQMEHSLVLPSLVDMKKVAARATLLGMDTPITDDYIRSLMAQYPDASEAAVREAAQDIAAGPATFGQAIQESPGLFAARLLAYPTRAMRYGLFNSNTAHMLLTPLKLGYILTYSNLLRNVGDEYLTINAAGRGNDLRYGKSVMRSRGETSRLIDLAHHLIPRVERAAIANPEDVERAIVIGRYRLMFGDRKLTDGEIMAADEIAERAVRPELERVLGARDYTAPEGGIDEAEAMHRAGVLSESIRHRHRGEEFAGYDEVALGLDDGGEGIESLAAMYVRQFAGEDEPARRVLAFLMWNEAIENPAFLRSLDEETIQLMQRLSPVDNDSLLEALAQVRGGTAGHARRGSGGMILPPSLRSIEDYVAYAPETARFRQLSEFLRTDERGFPIGGDDLEAAANATSRYVRAQVKNIAHMVSDRSGTSMNPALVSDLLHGRLPSASDLRNYGGKDPLSALPQHVVVAQFMPAVPRNPANKALGWYTHMLASAYEFMVTRPMQRIVRKPMFVGSYMKHRQETHKFELKLIGQGWQPENAKRLASDMAWGQALNDVVQLIDNPARTSQFSVLARNVWMFERAQEDAIRRWFRVLGSRPENLEYAHLYVHAGQTTGILDRDPEGNLILTYPGSGALIELFMHVGQLVGLGERSVKIPHVDDLTTRLDFLNPSIINPFGYSATPLVSIPLDFLGVAIPGDEMFKQDIELATEGEIGSNAGRGWYETFMPTAVNRLVELMGDQDSLGSTVGSAAASAMQNLAATGQLPDGSNMDESQDFVTNLQTQTWNALVGRALFSFFAPGATGLPELGGQGEADWSYRERGIQGLHDEFRAIVGELGYDKAIVAWAELHPERLIFDVGRTQVGATSATVSTSLDAANWMYENRDLFDESTYRSVAAYFVPNYPGEFDRSAWNSMLEIGVRQYKDLDQFYRQILERNATTVWFEARDAEEAELAEAREQGVEIEPIEEKWARAKEEIRARYPILQLYLQDPSREAKRQEQVRALERMVNDPELSGRIPEIPGVVEMLNLHAQYQEAGELLRGQRSQQASTQRQMLESQYHLRMQEIIARYPGLNDLYQGVFRYLQD
jgi:hypothetical protein